MIYEDNYILYTHLLEIFRDGTIDKFERERCAANGNRSVEKMPHITLPPNRYKSGEVILKPEEYDISYS